MKLPDSIEDFYKEKNLDIPSDIKWQSGYFDVIKVTSSLQRETLISQFSFYRKNLYKIKLIKGECKCHYASRTVDIKGFALIFVAPNNPFILEEKNGSIEEYFIVFNSDFFNNFGSITSYPVFQNPEYSIFSLSENGYSEFQLLLDNIQKESLSEYEYHTDLVRNMVYQLIHKVLKQNDFQILKSIVNTADHRIAVLFEELLSQQFPLHSSADLIRLKKPVDFADKLAISINHLNKAVKNIYKKTTTEVITERIMQEAMILLKVTNWSVSEIAYVLGYETPSRFIYTFRRYSQYTPSVYRKEFYNK
ncbi:AraC family transcriptional regulator [Elizabethkingia miricola]|uniref:AraC family transcriptional regulator n=1 Tax=Elizabethkingia miricola TaxID=172045 RepID=UPI0038918132